MTSKILLRQIYSEIMAENRQDRIKGLERSLELAFGRIEGLEKRNEELERYLHISFETRQGYERKTNTKKNK